MRRNHIIVIVRPWKSSRSLPIGNENTEIKNYLYFLEDYTYNSRKRF